MINIDAIAHTRTLPIEFTIEYNKGKSQKYRLELKPMKMKQIRKFEEKRKNGGVSESVEALKMILNTADRKLSDDAIDNLTIDQVNAICTAYLEWMNETIKN